MNKTDLLLTFGDELKKWRFQKKTGNWYLNEKEIIKVVNLQKSNYGNQYYVNLGVYFKGIDADNNVPKEQQCHIRTRLNSWIINSQKNYNYLFNLDTLIISKEEFEMEMKKCIIDNVIPQLNAIESKEKILEIIYKEPAFLNTIPLKVKSYFNLLPTQP
jgi:hypothetical protein